MYSHSYLLLVCLLTAAIFNASVALAQIEDREIAVSEIVAHFASEVNTSLEAVQQEDSGLAELQEYLYNCMAMVFYAKVDVGREIGPEIAPTNEDLTSLVELGYLPFWPVNPLEGMEPLEVVTPADGFTPNALCFALCPDSYKSYIRDGATERLSFDLFVYGPEGLSGFGQVIQPEGNKEWSSVPEGAIYGLGFFVDPVAVVDERKARQAQ